MSNRLVAVFTPFEELTDPRIARTRMAATRPADIGRVTSPGSVHPVAGHYGARYSVGQALPRVPLDGRPGTHAPQFRGDLDAIAVIGAARAYC